jgi:hypothetical protein
MELEFSSQMEVTWSMFPWIVSLWLEILSTASRYLSAMEETCFSRDSIVGIPNQRKCADGHLIQMIISQVRIGIHLVSEELHSNQCA